MCTEYVFNVHMIQNTLYEQTNWRVIEIEQYRRGCEGMKLVNIGMDGEQ